MMKGEKKYGKDYQKDLTSHNSKCPCPSPERAWVLHDDTEQSSQAQTTGWLLARLEWRDLDGAQGSLPDIRTETTLTEQKSFSPLYVPLSSWEMPLQQPRWKTDRVPWAARLFCQAAKSTKTTAQSQIVNTSADGSLLSARQARKLFLEHRQQLGGNICLCMYILWRRTRRGGLWFSNYAPKNWHKIP